MSSCTMREDEKLACRYRETREESCFSTLRDRHEKRLSGLLRSYTQRPDIDTEVIISESFERLHTFLIGQSPLENVAGWLSSTVKHAADAAFRQADRQKRGGHSQPLRDVADHTQERGVDHLICEELAGLVREAIATLPDRERLVVHCKLKGLTDEGIAKELGFPAGTVKSTYSRARGRLREALSSHILQKALA